MAGDRTLRDVMDDVRADGVAHLYDDLAPLYDFVYTRHFDYEALAGFLADHAPGARSVCVGACGAGHLLAEVLDRYDDVVGVDLNGAMLDRADRRVDAGHVDLVEADLREYADPGRFDAYSVLGNSLVHFDADEAVDALFARARESLAPGGAFVCDFIDADAFTNGYVGEDRFEGDRFVVDRTVVSSVVDAGGETGVDVRMAFAYEIVDRDRSETVRTGESMPGRVFHADALRDRALDAGFDDAEIVEGVGHDGGLVARR